MDKYTRDMAELKRESAATSKQIETGFKRGFASMAKSGAAIIGVAFGMEKLASFMGSAYREFAAFDAEMRNVNSIMGLSEKALSGVRGEVEAMSQRLGVGVVDLAQGLYQVASAGVDAAHSIQFLEVATKAGIAGVSSTETAVDGLTTVINAYGMSAESVGRVSDVMFQTVKLGKTTFDQLAASLANVLPIASASEVSFEEVSAAIAELTKQGTPTAVATTQIRAAIISLNDVLGDGWSKTLNLGQAMQKLVDLTGGSNTALKELMGRQEGVNAVLALAGDKAENYATSLQDVKNAAGAAGAAFEEMEKSATASTNKMSEGLKAFQRDFGALVAYFLSGVSAMYKDFKKLMGLWNEEPRGLKTTIQILEEMKASGADAADIEAVKKQYARELLQELTALKKEHKNYLNDLGSEADIYRALSTLRQQMTEDASKQNEILKKMAYATDYEKEALQAKLDTMARIKANTIETIKDYERMLEIIAEVRGLKQSEAEAAKQGAEASGTQLENEIKLLDVTRQKGVEEAKIRKMQDAKLQTENFGFDLKNTEKNAENYKDIMAGIYEEADYIAEGQRVVFGGIENAFSDMISGMIMRGESFSEAMKGIWQSMAVAFIGQITAMMAKWLAFQALTGLGIGFGGIGKFFSGSLFGANGGDFQNDGQGVKRMQTGGAFTVPPGFQNDSFPLMVESGEKVTVTPRARSASQESLLSGIISRLEALNQNLITGAGGAETVVKVDVAGEIGNTAIKLANDRGKKAVERYG
jgi:TP901 family phage tail tape measure protein